VSTSGSTGTPLVLYQDDEKRNRNFADTIFFSEKAGFKFGTKLIFMRVWTKYNRKNPFLAWIQNIEMQNVVNLNDEAFSIFIKNLKRDKREKGILSYASSLEALCKYLDKINAKPLDCNISAIISNSESLSEYTKTSINKYFKTSMISRYSNAENGIFAQQSLKGGHEFDINWGSYFIEILKFNEDVPVVSGELGRVVVTDLYNYCMPIIRYDTGDVANIELNSNNVPIFKCVEGRKLDLVYNTKGELISSLVIGGLMKKYAELKQFQFIQETKTNYSFKLNCDKEFKKEQLLIEEFKAIIGKESVIEIEYLNEIPTLSSGKRRQVINNYILK
jgi:phenylacetate-CoA ligase